MFRRHASLLVWVAYFVVPTDAAGLVRGIPLGPLETVALLMLAWLAIRREAPRRGWIVALVLVAATAGGTALPGTGGFRARYFANAAATGAPERSPEFNDPSFTRIDRRLDFGLGGQEFPLSFFNDIARFNFHDPAGPRRRYLEFAATWTGHWWVDANEESLYLDAPDAHAELFIDGARVAVVTPDTDATAVNVPLVQGWHRVDVTFSSPYGGPRKFSAGRVHGGKPQPFNDEAVFTRRVRSWQVTAAWLLRWTKVACDGLVIGWLFWLFVASLRRALAPLATGAAWLDRSRVAPVFAMLATVEALVYAWPWSRQLMVMPGGDDPMTYEWYSRDILMNGILMNGGAPLGTGEPFYYQALYPYFLAAVHAVFGEGMFGVMLAHHLLVAGAVWAAVVIAVMIAGEAAWPATLACGMVFAIGKHWPISSDLRNESLYVPLLVMWTAAMMRLSLTPSPARAIGAGALGAITAMTRSTSLAAWPLLFAASWSAWPRTARRRSLFGTLVLSSIAVFSLIAVRNWMVAHQVSFTSSELGITLLGGNEPPPGMTIDPERNARYQRAGISPLTAQVIEYAIVAPREFAMHQGRKALYALGYYEPYAPGRGTSPIYLVGWMLAVAGFIIAMRSPRIPRAVIAMPAMVSASQFISVVLVYPKDERLILPIYAVLVPYAGTAVAAAAMALWRMIGQRRPGRDLT